MGFAQFMVSSMKSNSRRQERTHFDKESIYLSSCDKKKKPVFKTATKEQLLKIKKNLQQSNRVYKRKLIGYTIFITSLIISISIFYLKHIVQL